MNEIVTVTSAAEKHIKNCMAKRGSGIGFRLAIKKTGCSGYAYVPDIIDTPNEKDIHMKTESGLNVYIDSDSASLLQGIIIDFEADKMGLKQERLIFINPNEKNRCGCGESFTIE